MLRCKFSQISTIPVAVEQELKECFPIVILLLLVASEAKNQTVACDPVAERYSVEKIAALNSPTPPLLPALTAPFLHPMTNSSDTCLKVASKRTIIAKQTFHKKTLYCLAFSDELGRATAFLDVHNFGDNGQFVLLATVEFREAKNTKFPQKM